MPDNRGLDPDRARTGVNDKTQRRLPEIMQLHPAARVGLILPDRLALGAASGLPVLSERNRMTGPVRHTQCHRLWRPAVAMIGNWSMCSVFGTTSVRGPGQKASARRKRLFVELGLADCASARRSVRAISAGLNCGLPLAAKMFAQAITIGGIGGQVRKPFPSARPPALPLMIASHTEGGLWSVPASQCLFKFTVQRCIQSDLCGLLQGAVEREMTMACRCGTG